MPVLMGYKQMHRDKRVPQKLRWILHEYFLPENVGITCRNPRRAAIDTDEQVCLRNNLDNVPDFSKTPTINDARINVVASADLEKHHSSDISYECDQ
jgi:hypothetical protein